MNVMRNIHRDGRRRKENDDFLDDDGDDDMVGMKMRSEGSSDCHAQEAVGFAYYSSVGLPVRYRYCSGMFYSNL